MITSRDFRKYKQELLEEFDRKCAYCGSPLGLTDNGHVEHFYPKSEYPERMLDADNLLIVCQICNISKAAFFPLDDDGNPILLNPRIDDFTTHIELQIDGTYVGLTERGTLTIDTLNLNRPQLVERRRYELYESQYYADRDDPVDVFKVFHDSLEKIALLNSMHLENANSTEQYFNNLLYANVITALESLLADTFITYVKANKVHLRNFVETFHDFEKEKFNLREVFLKYEGIEEKALQSIRDVIFHNLPKVKGMYEDTFGIEFPPIGELIQSVFVRHDLVHRNGKSKDGKFHNLKTADITVLCAYVKEFGNKLKIQMDQISTT